ncbi:MAG: acyl-protein synthetase [Tenericutes bacterium]|nr:acyl-protein synthetase [Mycoplasmatota bacterium]
MMKRKYVRKLFNTRKPYDLEKSNDVFCQAMRENAMHHYKQCPDYKRILDEANFDPKSIACMDDLINLPFLPTLYFKHHELFSKPLWKMPIKATSSGTSSGFKSKIAMSIGDLWRGFKMIKRIFSYHKLWSIRPVTYLIFGYQPTKHSEAGIMKTAYGFTYVAPAKKRVYAIRWSKENGYQVDLDYMKAAFIKASQQRTPIRTIGFPAYTYFLLKEMKAEGIKLQMAKGSKVTIGGGWKQFYAEKVDKNEFYQLVHEVLGIEEKNCVEFFGAVEHPILYTDCDYHHFHVPAYARVIIRDPDTFKPVPKGQMGLINLLTPMMEGTPLLSVMTDDLGVLHYEGCECGELSPWLEIIGRVGIKDITTCAQGADDLLSK